LLGFSGPFRRSELVALVVAESRKPRTDCALRSRRSKTDQKAQGQVIAVIRGGTCCPVKALPAWLDAAEITEEPIFRPIAKGRNRQNSRLSAKSVCDITKAYARRVGLDGAVYGALSLRSGFLTSAARREPQYSKCGMCRGTRAWRCS